MVEFFFYFLFFELRLKSDPSGPIIHYFTRLLLKLTTDSTNIFNSKFYEQSDRCTMGGPLSVTFDNIYLTKVEIDKVKRTKPFLYKRFVDDATNRRK